MKPFKRGRKPRVDKVKSKIDLFHGVDHYSPEEVKMLWDEYRMGKFYACMGDMLDTIAAYSVKKGKEYEYEEGRRIPAQGSIYWHETIHAPGWFFEEELMGRG